MSSQQPNPTEGHSPATAPNAAKAKADKAKKWAAFRAQNYDGEGWGDDYEDRGRPPQSPDQPVPPSHPPTTTVPSDNQPQVSNGPASSLPSQIRVPQITPELGRAVAATAPNSKRASGIYSGFNQSTLSSDPELSNIARVEQEPSSATSQVLPAVSEDEAVSAPPSQSYNDRDPRTASNTPTTPVGEPGQPPHTGPEKRYSTSPQLPDLARMSMFGDDLFKTSSLNEAPPPPMPSLPPPSSRFNLGGAGGVKHPNATAANVAPASSIALSSQNPRPQAASALASPALEEQPPSPTSSGDTAAGDIRAAAQLDLSTSVDISQKSPASPAVSDVGKAPELASQASALGPSGLAGHVTAAHPAPTSNPSSLYEPLASNQQARELSPSPLRSMSPSASPAEPTASSGNQSVLEHMPTSIPSTLPEGKEPAGSHDEPELGPYHRQSTMDTIASASSVPKESDKLHEEIFQSLAPSSASGEIAGESRAYQRKSTVDGIRESTYLPSVYDDYWATTAEDERDPAVPEVLRLPAGATEEAAVAPLRPGTKSPGAPASPQPLRKRFSWEQSAGANAVSPASRELHPSQAPTEPPAGVSHSPVQEAGSPKPEQGKAVEAGTAEEKGTEQGLACVSRHGSQTSKTKVGDSEELSKEQNRLSLAVEKQLMEASNDHLPTDPILQDHPALRDPAPYSPEHSIHDPAHDPAHDSPQDLPKEFPEDMPTTKSANPPSFREIMALGTSRERTAKFEETRSQFAEIDEGLSDWIATLKEMPEHAGTSVIFNVNGLPAPINSAPSALGQQSQTPVALGQPQQYIHAGSPTGGASGRPISTSLGSSTPASVFKHSSNQAGVKSKELLLAAGKAGKGLLSKGKNKLRGSTGDKNESLPPQSQPKPPSDSRTSWGVKFVTGAGGPAQPSTPSPGQLQQHTATTSSAASHLLTTRRGPDRESLPPLQLPPTGAIFADPELVSPVSDINSRISSDGDDVFLPQSSKVSIAPPTDKPQPWVPATGSPLAGQGQSLIATGLAAPGDDGATEEVKSDNNSNDWAATSPQQLVEHAQTGAHESSEHILLNRLERVSDTDATGHVPMDRSVDPQRPLPFAGLPPIRRSSTFGLALGETVRADEDDGSHDGNGENEATHESQVDIMPTISDVPPASNVRSDEPVETATLEGQTLGNDYATTEGQVLALVKQKNLSDDPFEQPAAVDKPPPTGDAVTAAAPGGDEPSTLISPADPTMACIAPGEQPSAIPLTSEQPSSLSSAGPSLVRSPPPHITVNAIQKLPPSGQWKMQESYLSEPLISPSRKRPTSVSSQSPSFVGFEKETGVGPSEEPVDSSDDGSVAGKAGKAGPEETQKQVHQQEEPLKDTQAVESRAEGQFPSAASLAPAGAPHSQPLQPGPPGRQKYGATPPVAMQRYRGLFAPKQPPMQVYTPPEAPSQSQPDLAECSGALPPQSSDAPPARSSSRPSTADGKGRRSSGIFGPIGDRFAKINADLAPQRGPNRVGEAANDGASETSVPAVEQRHRRRSSFFLNLKNSGTQHPGHQTGDSKTAISPTMVEHRSQPTPPPEERHKRSFFGAAKGRISTGVSSRFTPVLSRSSTANVEGNSTKEQEQEQGQGRARFGGLGMFKRSTGLQDSASLQEKPGSAGSMVPSIQSRPATGIVAPPEPSISNLPPIQSSNQPPPQGPGSLAPLPSPPTRGRSGTTGSVPGSSGSSPLSQASAVSEERGRRVSGPGAFLSNVWGNRSSSRSKEQGGRAGVLPQGQFGPLPGPQYSPLPGGSTPLGSSQIHLGHQGHAPPPFRGPQQQGPPRPPGRAQHSPTHQRQASAPGPAGSSTHQGPVLEFPTHQQHISVPAATPPTPQLAATRGSPTTPPAPHLADTQGSPATPTLRQSPLGEALPGQQTMLSTAQKIQVPVTEQANQGQQMQDWRPVPVQQPEAAESSAEPVPKGSSQGQTLEERSAEDGLAHAGLALGADTAVSEPKVTPDASSSVASPIKSSAESDGSRPVQDTETQAIASDIAVTTPNTERPLSIDEPSQADKDLISSVSSTDEPSMLPSLARPSATLSPQQVSTPSQQDLPKNLQLEGTPISGRESMKFDLQGAPASSTEFIKSAPSRSPPVGSASTQTPHLSPSKRRASIGQTVYPTASPVVEQTVVQADQGQEQLVQTQALPHGRLPSQLPPGQLPGQPLRGQPPYSYTLPPNAQQGQWRPFVPQELIPPGQLQGQPPWAMNRTIPEVSNAFGPQHSNTPAQFHAVPGPLQGSQPQRNEGQSSMSKWLKGKSSGQQQRQQTQQQPVQVKPEKSKSLFSAFKRPSKQTDTRPPGATQPQFAPGPGQHPVFASGGYPQQHHPQLSMDPAWAMAPSLHQQQVGQYRPAMPHQGGQQFAQAAYQFQPAPGQVLYMPGQPAQFQQYASNQVQQSPSIAPSRQTSMASSNQPRISVASESPIVQSPHPIGPQTNQGAPAQLVVSVGSQAPRPIAPVTQFGEDPKPSTTTDVNKPLPTPNLLHQQGSDVSQTPSISSAPTPPAEGASTTVATLEQAVRTPFLKPVDRKTLEHDRITDSQGSPTTSDAESGKKLTVDTEAAKRRSNETNLYDATPRGIPAGTHNSTPTSGGGPSAGVQTSSGSLDGAQDSQATISSSVQVQAPPQTPTTVQDSQTTTVAEEVSDDSKPTNTTEPSTQRTDQATQPTQTNDQAEPVESKQQAIIRKMRLEAQEEKILVPGQDGLPGAAEQDDDRPKMSATSYPGQEWNPYGGAYDFYQD